MQVGVTREYFLEEGASQLNFNNKQELAGWTMVGGHARQREWHI